MKQIIFALLPVVFGGSAFSQGIFYEGGWKTNDANQTTTLVIGSLATPKIFQVSSTSLDLFETKFQFVADNTNINTSYLPEGSFAVVEAQKLLIKQTSTGGGFMQGNWKIINTDTVPFKQIQWQYPKAGGRITVASFLNSTEFVISINPLLACTTAKMVIWVDGVPVPSQFLTGSSVIGKGKKVEVELQNICSSIEAYIGQLKYRTN